MKNTATIFFLFVFALSISSQKRYDLKLKLDGKDRECIIVKPSTPPPPGGYPVVFMLHGTSGDGEKFYNISGWKELGETENFVTVFPSSLTWCFVDDGVENHNTRWVNGSVIENPCSGPPQDYVDDIKFLKTLVKILDDSLKINTTKVFASGFSNGGCMMHKVANDAGDVFAAVGAGSGPLTLTDSVKPVRRIPVWFIVGSLDDRFIVPPYTELPFGGDSILEYLKEPINRALACQGLTSTYTTNSTPITHTYIFNENKAGENSKPYLFTLIKDMTHEYPNGINYPLSAPNMFWEFFKQSTVVATDNKNENDELITVFPNPSNSTVQITIKAKKLSNFNLKVLNCYGQTIFKEDNKTNLHFILDKNRTGLGLFIIQIQFGNRIICKKILFE